MKTSLLFLALTAFVAADKIPDFVVPGKCPHVDERSLYEQQRPNHPKYAGVWYEIAITNNPYQLIRQCVRNEYTFDGTKFNVRSTGIDARGSPMTRNGQVLPNPFGEAHLSVDYEGSWIAPYVILDTDYENFSYYRRCEAAFMNIGVEPSRFSKTTQGSSCPYSSHRSW
ncbi:crustacyanin subunit C [Penaeus vannamei]|uniref:Crustacyanin subunit C n=1 Tax=Penaeus vannamei TaxID=6689 RepID=A0A3R7PE10_PENVA|nr:crustacyanin subunit C [Penaeus vannamei]